MLYFDDAKIFLRGVTINDTNVIADHIIYSIFSNLKIQNLQLKGCSNGFLFITRSALHINNSLFDNSNSSKNFEFIEKSAIEIRNMSENQNNIIANSHFIGMRTIFNGSVN